MTHLRARRRSAVLVAGALATTALLSPGLGSTATAGPVATGWQHVEPEPNAWPFRDIDLVSSHEGWTVASPITGDHGVILHTTDGGRSWSQQGPTFRQLLTVSFADARHGVALGNELRYTTNGGRTWKVGSGVMGTVNDAELVTSTLGYAVGGNRVLTTTDGGAHWSATSLPVDGNLVAIDAVDTDTVIAAGAEGSAFRTVDGGVTWKRILHDPDRFYTGVSFVSAKEGWVTGDAPATILHTTDGGAHWTPQTVPDDGDTVRVRMVDAQHGWVVGTLRTILYTSNGGSTWTLQQGGERSDPNNRYPYWGIDSVDGETAVAVGAGVQLATTTDAGDTWTQQGNGSVTIPYRLVHTDADHVWAAASNSEVLYSRDGGRRWSRSIIQESLSCDICSNTSDLAFLDDKEGWATINGQFTTSSWVWHTTDGGVTWQSLNDTSTGPLTGIAALNRKVLVAVSAVDDVIYRSTNGGLSWVPVQHPSVPDFFGNVRFAGSTRTVYAVGAHGKILRSSDAGKTWVLQHGGGDQSNLFDVAFSDARHGWAVGGDVLRTSNGGRSWTPVATGISVAYGVSAPGTAVAWVSGADGVAYTTTGGAQWAREAPEPGAWYSVTALDGRTAWAGVQEEIDDVPGAIWRSNA